MDEGGGSVPWLRRTSDDESEIFLEILFDAGNEMFPNAEKLLATERAYEVDVQFQSMPSCSRTEECSLELWGECHIGTLTSKES